MKKAILLGLGIFLILVSPAFADLTTGLQYYSADNADTSGTTAIDSEENTNSTLTSVTTGQSGHLNQAYLYDGASSYSRSDATITWGQQMTFYGWVKVNSTQPDSYPIIFAGEDYTSTLGIFVYRDTVTNNICIYNPLGSNNACNGNTNIRDDTWHHIAVIFDQATSHREIVIDGNSDVNCSNAVTMPSGSFKYVTGTRIAATSPTADYYYKGHLDEFGVINKTLTNSEIWDLINNGNPFAGPTSNNTAPTIISISESPTDPTTYQPGQTYNFSALLCDADGTANISQVNLTFAGTANTITTYGEHNATCRNYWNPFYNLSAAEYNYTWLITDTENATATNTSNYTVNPHALTLTMSLNGSTIANNLTLIYPSPANISTYANESINISFYRDGVLLSNMVNNTENIILNSTQGYATFNYTANITGNYTGSISKLVYVYPRPNAITLTLSDTTVTEGASITAICSAAHNTPTLTRNGIGISNSYTAILGIGTHTFNCSVAFADNYDYNTTTGTITVIPSGAGCSENDTFAYLFNLNVTNDTTILDLDTLISDNTLRTDGQDIWINQSNITTWLKSSRYFIINTSGLNNTILPIHFGNYLNNMNHNTTWAGSTTPTNNISGYSNINPYVKLTFRNEVNGVIARPPNATIYLNFYCSGGRRGITLSNTSNLTSLFVATYENWTSLRATVEYAPDDKYLRELHFDAGPATRSLYLVDALTYQVAGVVFTLDDISGGWDTAELVIEKWIGSNQQIMTETYFDVSHLAQFYGITNEKYTLKLIKSDGTTKSLGFIYIDTSDLTKTLTVYDYTYDFEDLSELIVNVSYNYSTGTIRLIYYDPFNETDTVNMSIYNEAKDTLLYFVDANNSNDVTFTYVVPNRNATYWAKIKFMHHNDVGSKEIEAKITGWSGEARELIADELAKLPTYWQKGLGVAIPIALMIAFAPANAAWAAVVFVGSLSTFKQLGFVTDISWLLIGFMAFIATMLVVNEVRQKK